MKPKKMFAVLGACAVGAVALDLGLRAVGAGQQPITAADVAVSMLPAYCFLGAMWLDAEKRLDEAEDDIDRLAEQLPVRGLHVLGDDGAVEGQQPAGSDGEL